MANLAVLNLTKAILLFILVFGMLLTVPASAQTIENRAELYEIPVDFINQWDAINLPDDQTAAEALQKYEEAIANLPESQLAKRTYAKLSLIELMLTLEMSPEAMKKLDILKSDTATLPEIYKGIRLKLVAQAYLNMGQYSQGMESIERALSIITTVNSPSDLAGARIIRGQIHYSLEQYKSALDDYLFAYHIFKSNDQKIALGTTIGSIAQLYSKTGEHEKSIEYFKESLELIDTEEQKLLASIIVYNIGVAYSRIDDMENAEQYYRRALRLSEELDDQVGVAYVWRELGKIESNKKNHQAAIDYYHRAFDILEQLKDRRMLTSLHIALAENYHASGQSKLALDRLKLAIKLAKSHDINEGLLSAYKAMSKIQEELGNYKQSLNSLKQYSEQMVEINAKQNQQSLNELKVKFSTEAKEAQNQLLSQTNAINQLEIANQVAQKRVLWLLVIVTLLVVALTLFGLRRQTQLRKRFSQLALTDELTKAPNRRSIVRYAKDQMKESNHSESSLLIGLIDLDNFKKINDTYGHDVGDEILKHFYQRAKEVLRQSDRLGRFGGEEWLLVMPHSSIEQIQFIFERIRNAVIRPKISALPKEFHLTFSMGICQYNGEDSWESLLKKADDAVYQAKSNGRDQWVES